MSEETTPIQNDDNPSDQAETSAAGEESTAASEAPVTDAEQADAGGTSSQYGQLPPATFSVLVSMMSTQAMVALGMLPNPVTQKAESDLGLARHFIDLLTVLEEKTQGNLTTEESVPLNTALTSLRMAFIELSKQK